MFQVAQDVLCHFHRNDSFSMHEFKKMVETTVCPVFLVETTGNHTFH